MRRMFNGILSDVIGRDGHVSESGNGNNNNDGKCAERFRDRWTQDVVSTVGIFERYLTRYHNHTLRVRDSAAVTSWPPSASRRHGDQEPQAATDVESPTSVSRKRLNYYRPTYFTTTFLPGNAVGLYVTQLFTYYWPA